MALTSGIGYAYELTNFTQDPQMYHAERGAIEFAIATGYYLMTEPDERRREENCSKFHDLLTEFVLGEQTPEQTEYFSQLIRRIGVSFDPFHLQLDDSTGVLIRMRDRIEGITTNTMLKDILQNATQEGMRQTICETLGKEMLDSFHTWAEMIAPLREGVIQLPEGAILTGSGEIK